MDFKLPKFFPPNFLQSLFANIFTTKIFYCTLTEPLILYRSVTAMAMLAIVLLPAMELENKAVLNFKTLLYALLCGL